MVLGCPLEDTDYSTGEFVKYAYAQWRNGTPIVDPLHGPHCLIDMIRYWAFIDSQEQARQTEEMMRRGRH